MLWFTLCLIAISIIVIRVINSLNYWKKRNVVYKKTWPLVGSFKDAILRKRNLADIVRDSYKEFPTKRYYGSFMFTSPCLYVTDVDLIKKITIKDFDHFTDHFQFTDADVEPLFAKNLVALRGQKWREMRNTLSPSFTGNKIRIMFGLMSDCAEQFTQHFFEKNQEVIEIEAKDVMTRIAINIIATTAFGVQCNSFKEDNEFYNMAKVMTQSNSSAFLKLMIQLAFPKISKTLGITRIPRKTTKFFEQVIKETLKQREERNIIRPDMIHIMMEAKKGKKRPEETHQLPDAGFAAVEETELPTGEYSVKNEITVEDIVSQGFLFFFAGFEIVSTLLACSCYELAVNPEVQERLQAEVDSVFDENKEFDYEALVKMKYLDMVISELLRKWPLGTFIERECVRDYKIEASEEHGEDEIIVEKGVVMFIPVIGIHYDPKYYLNPEKFDPERFSDENKKSINPYTYLPFGIGPRNCIGSRLALLETKVLMVYLLSKFEIVVVEKTQIPLVFSPKKPFMSPENFWLGLKKRTL